MKGFPEFVDPSNPISVANYERIRTTPEFKPSTLETYRTDAILVRSFKPACAGTVTQRGKVGNAPSRRSLNRLVFLLNNCDVIMQSMLTITMSDQVSRRNTIEFHKGTLKAALEKLRYDGIKQYCWVREFQKNGSVHWHIFTDLKVSSSGKTNRNLSKVWCRWMVNRYLKGGWINPKSETNMMEDGKDGFVGCCRFEQLQGDIGGRYAGKEGSKRFQKLAPKRWRDSGGNWWRASGNVKCTPTGIKKVAGRTLDAATIKINGRDHEVPYRVQFNKGMPKID